MPTDLGRLAFEIGLGLGTGLLSGMLGIGGAVLLIPAIVFVLAVEQHTAQAVSLAVIVPTAAAGALVHYRQGFVVPRVALVVGPASIAFAVVSAQVAGMLDAAWLAKAFGALLLFVGIRMVIGK